MHQQAEPSVHIFGLVREAGGHILSKHAEDATILTIRNVDADQDALDLANKLYESGSFEFAEPDYLLFNTASSGGRQKVKLGNPAALACTNDPLFAQQWGFHNTGQNGGVVDADMDIPEAWNITTGSSNIKIAVLDDGIEYAHPDLGGMLAGVDLHLAYLAVMVRALMEIQVSATNLVTRMAR